MASPNNPAAIALDAILRYDRHNTHLVHQDYERLKRAADHAYIDEEERLKRLLGLFASRGVIPNRSYTGSLDRYLLPLGERVGLSHRATAVLRRLYPRQTYPVPRMYTVDSGKPGMGNSYVVSADLAVVDPQAIRGTARLFGVDPTMAVDLVTLHEAVHLAGEAVLER